VVAEFHIGDQLLSTARSARVQIVEVKIDDHPRL